MEAEMPPRKIRWYHAHSGLFFGRDAEGNVLVLHKTDVPSGGFPGDVEPEAIVLIKETWASAVASVSSRGEILDTYERACELHDGESTREESSR